MKQHYHRIYEYTIWSNEEKFIQNPTGMACQCSCHCFVLLPTFFLENLLLPTCTGDGDATGIDNLLEESTMVFAFMEAFG